jgi:hypothetical protein
LLRPVEQRFGHGNIPVVIRLRRCTAIAERIIFSNIQVEPLPAARIPVFAVRRALPVTVIASGLAPQAMSVMDGSALRMARAKALFFGT